jgi:hypothetical protein
LQFFTGQATEFVHFPTTFKVEPHPSVGLGTDCRLESKKITSFALAHNDRILHLSAFSRTGIDSKEQREILHQNDTLIAQKKIPRLKTSNPPTRGMERPFPRVGR